MNSLSDGVSRSPSVRAGSAEENGKRAVLRVVGAILMLVPASAWAQTPAEPQPLPEAQKRELLEQQIQELLAMRREMQQALLAMQRQVSDFDDRIGLLETELTGGSRAGEVASSTLLTAAPGPAPAVSKPEAESPVAASPGAKPAPSSSPPLPSLVEPETFARSAALGMAPSISKTWGDVADYEAKGPFEPGAGMVLARGPLGEVSFAINTYVRYLNQENLDPTYTDSFGRTFEFDKRQDLQLNRENLIFRGWLFDEQFRWNFWTWGQSSTSGDPGAQTLGGNFTYLFSDKLALSWGMMSVPSTRSTAQTVPNWLKVDHRTMADEFFRGSYTMMVMAEGRIAPKLEYHAALANNLSSLGVNASELDNDLNTFSTALWWMPTTGEFGTAYGFGDYEEHEKLATLFGVHFTHSREDAQGQPEVGDFENAQMRLSDGTLLFSPDPFNTGGSISRATYDMLDLAAGLKYRGWSLEGEYYFRWLTDFAKIGEVPVDDVFDHGFQLLLSKMLVSKELQAFVAGSAIIGDYGDPWEVGGGLTWYPFKRWNMRVQLQALYEEQAASGSPALPFQVGADGWIYTLDAGFWF